MMKQHDFNSPCVSTPQGGEPPMTRAEVLAAREAYVQGGIQARTSLGYTTFGDELGTMRSRAARMFPMPTKIVPREVETSTGTKYRVRDGRVEWKHRGSYNWTPTKYTPDDYALIATLKDNPTCEVEA